MPKLSEKGIFSPSSCIRKIIPLADQARKKGIKIYHVNVGQSDIANRDIALETMRNVRIKIFLYDTSEGLESYREKLVEYYAQQNISLLKYQLIVTKGGSETISFVLVAITDPGDNIISLESLYANYKGMSIFYGIKTVPITSNIEKKTPLSPIETLEEKITTCTKTVLICNPSNPTGYLYSEKELLQLKNLFIKHNLLLIADEVYREFAYDNSKHFSILQSDGLEEHAVIIDSIFKRHSIYVPQISCIASKTQDLISYTLKFAQIRLKPSFLSQIISKDAVDTPKTYFEEVISEYTLRQNTFLEGFELNQRRFITTVRKELLLHTRIARRRSEIIRPICFLQRFHHKNQTMIMVLTKGFTSYPT